MGFCFYILIALYLSTHIKAIMQNKKIDLEKVEAGILKSAEHLVVFKKQVKAMSGQAVDSTTAVDFLINLEQDFDKKDASDPKAPSNGLLFVIGTCKGGPWKEYMKAQIKNNKKKFLIGTCYIKTEAGGETLYLIPEKGAATSKKIAKAGRKMFDKLGLSVAFESGMEIEDEDVEEATENIVNAEPKPSSEEDAAAKAAAAQKLIEDLSRRQMQLKGHWDNLKNALKDKEQDNATLVKIFGALKTDIAIFKQKLTELQQLGVAEPQVKTFTANVEQLEKALEQNLGNLGTKLDGALEKVKTMTLDLVNEINTLLAATPFAQSAIKL